MQFWNEYVAGMESIWCLLTASIFAFVLVTSKWVGIWSARRLAGVAKDEAGATYMLPLVLTIPFYVLLIAMIIECTLILTTKIGCVGAAYSAARSAAVWLPYENAMPKDAPDYTPLEDRQSRVRSAAARAMWAYASGAKAHATDAAMDALLNETIDQQILVFQAYSGNQKYDADYLKRKFAYAYNSSTIEPPVYLDPKTAKEYAVGETPAFNAKIKLTLRYEAPFHTAGIGRLFGERSQFGSHFVRPVITTVTIENEGVKSNMSRTNVSPRKLGKSLGIKYYDRATVIGQAPFGANSISIAASQDASTNKFEQNTVERNRLEQTLAQLRQRLVEAVGEEKANIAELIEDYRIALGETPNRPYSEDYSWYGSNTKPEVAPQPTNFITYALETRWAYGYAGGAFGRTFVVDPATGRVRLYRHVTAGPLTGPSQFIVSKPRMGLGVAYAEIEGVSSSFELESSEVSFGGDLAIGFGGVSQSNLSGELSGGYQAGAMIGGSLGFGITRYSFAGEYPSLEAAGFDALWTRRDQSKVWR